MTDKGGHILLLEHDVAAANEIADQLVSRGYYVEIVHQLDPSLDGDIDEDVDVVLCDIDMPGVSWDRIFEILLEQEMEITAICSRRVTMCSTS